MLGQFGQKCLNCTQTQEKRGIFDWITRCFLFILVFIFVLVHTSPCPTPSKKKTKKNKQKSSPWFELIGSFWCLLLQIRHNKWQILRQSLFFHLHFIFELAPDCNHLFFLFLTLSQTHTQTHNLSLKSKLERYSC